MAAEPPPSPPLPPTLFATLTPVSTLAKLAFSNAFECHFRDQTAARQASVHVSMEQTFDSEVMRFRRRLEEQRRKQHRRMSIAAEEALLAAENNFLVPAAALLTDNVAGGLATTDGAAAVPPPAADDNSVASVAALLTGNASGGLGIIDGAAAAPPAVDENLIVPATALLANSAAAAAAVVAAVSTDGATAVSAAAAAAASAAAAVASSSFTSTNSGSGSGSDMDIDVDTDTDAVTQALGMIWTGFYGFEFDAPQMPASAQFGWTVGKGRPGPGAPTDFLLVTRRFARDFRVAMHGIHARFNFHPDNTIFFLAKVNRAADTEVTLEGSPVQSAPAMLNKTRMAVRIGALEYAFEYAPFARTDAFLHRRSVYLDRFNASAVSSGSYIPPTPRPGTRTFASFTIFEPLGKGASGKVWSACDVHGRVVAIKIQELNRRNADIVAREVSVLQELTELADASEDGKRHLLRLTQVLRASGDTVAPLVAPFEDIGLVMEPVAPLTLTGIQLTHLKSGVPLPTALLLHGIIEAVNFLHSHGWIHRDLKRENIGIVGNPPHPLLLDLGGAVFVGPDLTARVAHTPGTGGTVGYLAPERELGPYDAGVDVWAVGVVGYELAKGRHPWHFAVNPWRAGDPYERERPRWEYKYREAMDGLERISRIAGEQYVRGEVVYVEPLLREMLRYPWASRTPRITMADSLQHPLWAMLPVGDDHLPKKTRR